MLQLHVSFFSHGIVDPRGSGLDRKITDLNPAHCFFCGKPLAPEAQTFCPFCGKRQEVSGERSFALQDDLTALNQFLANYAPWLSEVHLYCADPTNTMDSSGSGCAVLSYRIRRPPSFRQYAMLKVPDIDPQVTQAELERMALQANPDLEITDSFIVSGTAVLLVCRRRESRSKAERMGSAPAAAYEGEDPALYAGSAVVWENPGRDDSMKAVSASVGSEAADPEDHRQESRAVPCENPDTASSGRTMSAAQDTQGVAEKQDGEQAPFQEAPRMSVDAAPHPALVFSVVFVMVVSLLAASQNGGNWFIHRVTGAAEKETSSASSPPESEAVQKNASASEISAASSEPALSKASASSMTVSGTAALSAPDGCNIAAAALGDHPLQEYGQEIPVAAIQTTGTASLDRHPAELAIDGQPATSWQSPDQPCGLAVSLGGMHEIHALTLQLGSWESEDKWNANACPTSLSLVMNGQSWTMNCPDQMETWLVPLSSPVQADSLELDVTGVRTGAAYTDICISEIRVFGA